MKKYQFLLVAPVLAGLLSGCNNTHKTDSKATADTLNNMKDSVADPNRSITKDLVMKVSHDDARFAVAAADGGMAEVQLGHLASEKGTYVRIFDPPVEGRVVRNEAGLRVGTAVKVKLIATDLERGHLDFIDLGRSEN